MDLLVDIVVWLLRSGIYFAVSCAILVGIGMFLTLVLRRWVPAPLAAAGTLILQLLCFTFSSEANRPTLLLLNILRRGC